MTPEHVNGAAEGMYRGAIVVSEYLDSISKHVLGTLIDPKPRENALYGMFLRAVAWMRTLKKLTGPTDFQAVVACNRALIEITVDIILLHCDKSEASSWRIHWWEQSAKLKSAKALLFYYAHVGLPVPDSYSEQSGFVARQEAKIVEMRNDLWPALKGKHPDRWTGTNLAEDVRAADKCWLDEIVKEFSTSLTEFYETEYRKMNWSVHGSALAGVRDLSPIAFHYLCGLAHKWSSDLAMLSAKAVLIDFRFATHLLDFAANWEEVRQHRLLVYADSVGLLASETQGQD
jgi:hypothetical protein